MRMERVDIVTLLWHTHTHTHYYIHAHALRPPKARSTVPSCRFSLCCITHNCRTHMAITVISIKAFCRRWCRGACPFFFFSLWVRVNGHIQTRAIWISMQVCVRTVCLHLHVWSSYGGWLAYVVGCYVHLVLHKNIWCPCLIWICRWGVKQLHPVYPSWTRQKYSLFFERLNTHLPGLVLHPPASTRTPPFYSATHTHPHSRLYDSFKLL